MPDNPAIRRSPLHCWMAYISLLFLGFFPGAFLMYVNQKQEPSPATLEYDLMILRVPAAAKISEIPDFEAWHNPAIGRPLHEQGWRILLEPKLMSTYPGDIRLHLGPILGLDGNPGNGPDYQIRFITKATGAQLQTHIEVNSDAVSQIHNVRLLPGETHIQPLNAPTAKSGHRYFLLFRVTPHHQFQIGAPLIAPAGGATATSP
jgi:hypothetical protein